MTYSNDVWATYNGTTWILLNGNSSFGPRAWFGSAALPGKDPRIDIAPPRNDSAYIFVVGGGNIGESVP